ncbi:MAG: hypothetical protein AB9873_05750 [Syntrophobacteraceae bacterium]
MRYPTLFAILMGLVLLPAPSRGQELLMDSGYYPKQYLIAISGAAGDEKFSGVRGILSIEEPLPLSLNTYLVIVKGYPQTNTRNCFYWFSEDTSMTDISNEIVCDIKATYLKQPDVHFYFMSPTLLENKAVFLTQREKERRKLAEKRALPTRVYARAGRLNIRFLGNEVSGTVSMNGYDYLENAYVEYKASFSGQATLPIEPRKDFKK